MAKILRDRLVVPSTAFVTRLDSRSELSSTAILVHHGAYPDSLLSLKKLLVLLSLPPLRPINMTRMTMSTNCYNSVRTETIQHPSIIPSNMQFYAYAAIGRLTQPTRILSVGTVMLESVRRGVLLSAFVVHQIPTSRRPHLLGFSAGSLTELQRHLGLIKWPRC